MKNRKVFFASVVLMLLVVVTCYTVSGTYAKYTTSLGGDDTARVALWSWEINDTEIAKGTTKFNMNLFDTLKDSDLATAEGDVASKNSDNVIAPGTSGSFAIKIKNNSEVNATYAIDFTVTGIEGASIVFGTNKDSLGSDITDIAATNIDAGKTETVTVYWKWLYEDSKDATDTELGFAGNAEANVAATLTLTQRD